MSQTSKKGITEEIKDFISGPENTLQKWNDEPAWKEPLVGFSNAADPLYQEEYKEHIGEFFIPPDKYLSDKYQNKEFNPKNLTVISWILPQTEKTKEDHGNETYFPSERWARSRIFGEEANVKLRKRMVKKLENRGVEAVAPQLSSLWEIQISDKYEMASTWSERHAAYAAGLGTFGLCDGLITEAGKAMRAGSVVANIYVEPDDRPYDDHHAYCLYYQKGTCSECIERCPIDAITQEEGHDKPLCRKYVDMTRDYVERHFGFEGYGCGFCQTDVPCESGIPEELKPDSEA